MKNKGTAQKQTVTCATTKKKALNRENLSLYMHEKLKINACENN